MDDLDREPPLPVNTECTTAQQQRCLMCSRRCVDGLSWCLDYWECSYERPWWETTGGAFDASETGSRHSV